MARPGCFVVSLVSLVARRPVWSRDLLGRQVRTPLLGGWPYRRMPEPPTIDRYKRHAEASLGQATTSSWATMYARRLGSRLSRNRSWARFLTMATVPFSTGGCPTRPVGSWLWCCQPVSQSDVRMQTVQSRISQPLRVDQVHKYTLGWGFPRLYDTEPGAEDSDAMGSDLAS